MNKKDTEIKTDFSGLEFKSQFFSEKEFSNEFPRKGSFLVLLTVQ